MYYVLVSQSYKETKKVFEKVTQLILVTPSITIIELGLDLRPNSKPSALRTQSHLPPKEQVVSQSPSAALQHA